ncbi:MAG: OmpH family outer membrane protein [Pedosphaera sp.]|nr:OmpH family outer membrane protein [Pedosphaera sp.]
MNKLISKIIVAVVLAGFCAPAWGQTSTATVDLKKLFESYWRTKVADAAIKERAADLDKELKGLGDDYDKAKVEYQKLLNDANDQAVSAAERDKRKSVAEAKLKAIRETEDTIVTFRRNAKTTLDELTRRMRDEVLKKIREAINAKAKSAGFGLVFDAAAETVNGTPTIVYSSGDNDLTQPVLDQLNADAPPELVKPTENKTLLPAKEEKKDGKK